MKKAWCRKLIQRTQVVGYPNSLNKQQPHAYKKYLCRQRYFIINWYGSVRFRGGEKTVGSEEFIAKHRNIPTHQERLLKGAEATMTVESKMTSYRANKSSPRSTLP